MTDSATQLIAEHLLMRLVPKHWNPPTPPLKSSCGPSLTLMAQLEYLLLSLINALVIFLNALLYPDDKLKLLIQCDFLSSELCKGQAAAERRKKTTRDARKTGVVISQSPGN